MSRLARIIVFLLFVGHAMFGQDRRTTPARISGGPADWFTLQTTREDAGRQLIKGSVAAAFNDVQTAEGILRNLIVDDPASRDARVARGILVDIYCRLGRYNDALRHVKELHRASPNDADFVHAEAEFELLGRHGDQRLEERGSSRFVNVRNELGFISMPGTINGKATDLIVDTGATISTMTQSLAKRLGLTIEPLVVRAIGISGDLVSGSVTVADALCLGAFRFRNVSFWVVPDDQLPEGIGTRQIAVLGIPILTAIGTLRWTADGSAEIGRSSLTGCTNSPNLCIWRRRLLVDASYHDQKVTLQVDTGAKNSVLSPMFAERFLRADSPPHRCRIDGMGKASQSECVTVPEAEIGIGRARTVGRELHVLLRQGDGSAPTFSDGVLGLDLLGQSKSVSVDFRTMRLKLDQ